MAENYLNILADTIRNNWDAPALTDFYLTEDGSAQDTSRGNRYTYGEMYAEICRVANLLTSLGLQKRRPYCYLRSQLRPLGHRLSGYR